MHTCNVPTDGRHGALWRCRTCKKCWHRHNGTWHNTTPERTVNPWPA